MLAVGALAVPIYALTGSSVATYNATLILTLALSALTMFLLGRELSGSAWAGVIAGASFAFTTANYDSLARIQVVSSQWTPLTLFFLVRTLRSRLCPPGPRLLLLRGLFCGPAARGVSGVSRAHPSTAGATVPLGSARGGRGFGRFAAPARQPDPTPAAQSRRVRKIGGADGHARHYLAADPGNWIHARLFGASGLGYDARYFPGLIPVVLALVGTLVMLRRRRDLPESSRYVIPIAWLGRVALALALGDRVTTPWGDVPGPLAALRPWVPGLAETRVPARFVMFARVAMSALAAMGAAALLRALRARPRLAVSTGLVLALAVHLEHLSTPIDTWRVPVGDAVPPVYRWLAEQPEVAVVEFPPFPVRRRREETLWLHLSALHWKRIANGYASFYPTHYDLFVNTLLVSPARSPSRCCA